MAECEVMVVGAGAAGLAIAAMLQGHGFSVVVLERAQIGASWRARYDRLRLNSTRLFSSLPGHVLERAHGRWVHRDDYAAYLERYADLQDLEVRCGIEVLRVDRRPGYGCRRPGYGWQLKTTRGTVEAGVVVVATGYDHDPQIPDWPGREEFAGRLLHAGNYRRPDEFAGQAVLVVGSGNSGFEIALDLAERGAGKVWLAVRSAPIILAHE